MNAVKLGIGCGLVALVVAGQCARLPDESRRQLAALAASIGVGEVTRASGIALPATNPAPAGTVAFSPSNPFGAASESLSPDRYGQFTAEVEIGGERLRFLVDTGASFVALSYEDATRLGFRPMPSDYTGRVSTANGTSAVASVEIPEIRLGTITVRRVPAVVGVRGALRQSLLGMSFLGRLGGLRVEGGRLLLRQ